MDLSYAALVQCWLRSQKDEYVKIIMRLFFLSLVVYTENEYLSSRMPIIVFTCVEWAGMAQSV